ncbi:MAG: RidA family protein [Candidatus Aminicenantes bacterium]|nr:RidA family protein [Candidatus Aminicenantes bacterium]
MRQNHRFFSFYLLLIFILAWFLVGARFLAQEKVQIAFLNPPEKSQAPFSEAVRVGHWLILSGQLGRDPRTGQLVEGGIEAETRQVLENIKRTLEKYGSSLDKVVKCTVMLTDMADWEKMNKIYLSFFPKNRPARSTFGVSGLAGGAKIEIECWAIVD